MSEKVYAAVTDRIIQQLEAGTVPWRMSWAAGAGLGECKNLLSGKPYRGFNAFVTAMMGYRSPYFLTRNQANELGAKLKDGQKYTPVVFWSKFEVEGDTADDTRSVPFARYYQVFNAEQFDWPASFDTRKLYPSDLPTGKFDAIDACEALVLSYADRPKIQWVEQRAYYSPRLDYVNMPKPETFTSAEEYYSTLFHELGHSTGHESRLKRHSLEEVAGRTHAYSKEELVAEFTAAFLCAVAGIEQPVIENQAAYIAGWLKVLKNDRKLLVAAAGLAQKAADHIRGVKPQSAEVAA